MVRGHRYLLAEIFLKRSDHRLVKGNSSLKKYVFSHRFSHNHLIYVVLDY